MPASRYDGKTNWYESFASSPEFVEARSFAVDLLGHPGSGGRWCLDLGCGTGWAFEPLKRRGWSVVGVDSSADQLRVARRRMGAVGDVILADAHDLPFADGTFDAVVSFLTHTDFDDVERCFAEAARATRPGGRFVYLGVHPCFATPFSSRAAATSVQGAAAVVFPGYRETGWHTLPDENATAKVRARVGINHVTLAQLINATIDAGYTLRSVAEPGTADPPIFIALDASKPLTGRDPPSGRSLD